MAGTMNEADLVTDLKASLNDAASVFTAATDGDFKRQLAAAALAFGAKRPRTMVGTITLVADQPQYDAPADFQGFKSSLWGISPARKFAPWEKTWTGRLPDVRLVETSSNPVTRKLELMPGPSGFQISALGAEFRFYYYAAHSVNASAALTTIQPGDRQLLILRAQVEALRELAVRNVTKPIVMREAMTSQARNGTASYLYEKLLSEFREAA